MSTYFVYSSHHRLRASDFDIHFMLHTALAGEFMHSLLAMICVQVGID